jgi:two-component system, chemotaxis family, CheB/CheR fusion protein
MFPLARGGRHLPNQQREELQSTNEEIQAINLELRERGEALNDVNHFLESIMRGLRGAVIVVDQELHVLAWNHRSEDM